MSRTPRHCFAATAAIAVFGTMVMAGCSSGGGSGVLGEPTPTNLQVMRELVVGLGAGILDSVGGVVGDTVLLDVDSSEAAWIARTEIAVLLGNAGRAVLVAPSTGETATRWSIRGLALGAEYRDIRRQALFSGVVVDRVITTTFTSELSRGGSVLYAGTSTGNHVDTVSEDDVAALESGSPEGGRGRIPEMQTLDRYVEPFVIIGAAGAAIFLFFQVRS